MTGRKLYYELDTGDVILEISEKHNFNAINTTREQDFAMYDVLQARNPESVGLLQLDYGQYRGDFELANSVKVDIETGDLLFEFPKFEPPMSTIVSALKEENQNLKNEVIKQKDNISLLEGTILELTSIIADLQGGTI